MKNIIQLKEGTYTFEQLIREARRLGFTSIGFDGSAYQKPKVYYFTADNLIPDPGELECYSWSNQKYRIFKDAKDVVNGCFLIPGFHNTQDNGENFWCQDEYGYINEDGILGVIILSAQYKSIRDPNSYYYLHETTRENFINLKVEIKTIKNLKFFDDKHFLTSQQEMKNILTSKNLWLNKFAEEQKIQKLQYLFMAPYMETLYKADYSFAIRFINSISSKPKIIDDYYRVWSYYIDQSLLNRINRLCQIGGSPKEIFKVPKELYTLLKNCSDIDIWDNLRIIMKKYNISIEIAMLAMNNNYSSKDYKFIREILNKKYHGKQIFTFETLINYLNRVDMNEAIDSCEALELISDYLHSCAMLDQEPNFEADSLKRIHDVAARSCRQINDTSFTQQIAEKCEYLEKYNYSEKDYFIRAIRDQMDLNNEASQQRNCVACYAKRIAIGESYIFVCRRVDNPDKSLVTVQLSSTCRVILQDNMAHNTPVWNKEIIDFLGRWIKRCKKIKDQEDEE